ncbi:MAG TPA: transcription elongation factor GreA [Acidimicrobiales bacterium]|jgi:transcription elongation factor GreA|nr:transcription elongation factor GreA [Acidimicrobiales bacterium]
MAEVHELSRATYERLRAELEELTGAGRIDIAHKIEAARALGDLSENGDYHAAKEQQGKMEARIRQIAGLLEDAVVVDTEATDTSRVGVGTVVTLRFEGDDGTERFLVGSIEERHDEAEVLSPGSPLGRAVLGATAGDHRTYEVNGNQLGIHIVGIEAG